MLTLPCSAATLLLLCASPALAQFTIDGTALPAQNSWTDGVELTDVDGDGDLDLVFANGQGYGSGGQLPQHLFLNDGTGTYTAAHAQLNVASFNAKMVIGEDFDNDGDVDLLFAVESSWPSPSQKPRLLINDGTGNFTDDSAARLPAINMASFCVCAGDVDDDGDLDVVFTDGGTFSGAPSQARLFENTGGGFFVDATSDLPVDLYNAQDVTLFDWEGDFDIDIALSGKGATGKRSRLYLNDGTGAFSVSNVLDGLGSGGTYEIEWGDLDGDNDLDGMVVSLSGFSDGIAINSITSVSSFNLPSPNGNDDNEMAALDYDDDGDLDVLIGSLGNSGEKLYRNNGGGSFTNVNAQIQTITDSTLDLAVGDIDGDGDYDFVTGQGESGSFTNRVYRNGGVPDTRAPVILGMEVPAFDPLLTVFHARTQDAVVDDGDPGYVTARYRTWQGTSAGVQPTSGRAFHQGGGSWRFSVPTLPGAPGLASCWDFEDAAGNRSERTLSLGTVLDWNDLGNGTAGTPGVPTLTGVGTPALGAPLSVQLSGGLPSTFGGVVASSQTFFVPVLGGILVPRNNVVLVFATDGNGAATIDFLWPTNTPPCTAIYFQALLIDAGAPAGWSFSNAIAGVQQ